MEGVEVIFSAVPLPTSNMPLRTRSQSGQSRIRSFIRRLSTFREATVDSEREESSFEPMAEQQNEPPVVVRVNQFKRITSTVVATLKFVAMKIPLAFGVLGGIHALYSLYTDYDGRECEIMWYKRI